MGSIKLNGSDLMNLTWVDMQTKLEISIPNHRTTLSASIERLKKKSRRRVKSPNSPFRTKTNPVESPKPLQLEHLDDIRPNNKKTKAKDDTYTVSLNTKSKTKKPTYLKSKSLGYG